MSRQFEQKVDQFVQALDNHPGQQCLMACEAVDRVLGEHRSVLTFSQLVVSMLVRVLVNTSPDKWDVILSAVASEALSTAEEHMGVGETRH